MVELLKWNKVFTDVEASSYVFVFVGLNVTLLVARGPTAHRGTWRHTKKLTEVESSSMHDFIACEINYDIVNFHAQF